MIAERKYKRLTPELRAAAVQTVAKVATEVSSRWRAIELVAETLEVHPNTLRNWVVAAGRDAAPVTTSVRRNIGHRRQGQRGVLPADGRRGGI